MPPDNGSSSDPCFARRRRANDRDDSNLHDSIAKPFAIHWRSTSFSGTSSSPRDARSDSLHHLHDFLEGLPWKCLPAWSWRAHRARRPHSTDHCGSCPPGIRKSGRKRRNRPLRRGSKISRFSRLLACVELAVAIADRAPIIQSRSLSFPEGGGHNLERITFTTFAIICLKPSTSNVA